MNIIVKSKIKSTYYLVKDWLMGKHLHFKEIEPLPYDVNCEHKNTTNVYNDGDEFIMWCDDCNYEFHLKGAQIDDTFVHE